MLHLAKFPRYILVLFLVSHIMPGCKPTTVVRPKADFSFTYGNAGVIPGTVNFTSTSTGASSYSWRFGDGNSGSGATVSNTYAQAGTYSVTLTATGAGGVDSITKSVAMTLQKPAANFSFTIVNNGDYPVHVNFTNQSTGSGVQCRWSFDNGDTSNLANVAETFNAMRTFNVKLVVTNTAGVDSITRPVTITINPPTAAFSYTILNAAHLPLNIATLNTSGKAAGYSWDFGDGSTSTQENPSHSYTKGGIYTLTLTATNPGGSIAVSQQVFVSPYPVKYTDFNGAALNLYAWEGKKVAILSRNASLNPMTMFAWATTMDSVYNFYKRCTGREPGVGKMVNNHTTVADVPSTCGAGCGYLGATGLELQDTYFDIMYNGINDHNQYDQANFYEFGRNFWFYGGQLAYKSNDPITTGYAVLMRFMAMDATGVQGGPFNGTMSYAQFRSAVESLVDQYTGNPSLNWANTLGANAGVPGGFGGAADLFASFCMRLRRDYGGDNFIANVWKYAGQASAAATTQDAVDNFILAACAAAGKNLTNLFTVEWRWPMSAAAQAAAAKYP